MEEEGSSQGDGPRRKGTSDVRRAWRRGQTRYLQGAGREKVGQASAHSDCVSPFRDNYYNLAEHGQCQPLGSACCTYHMINPHNHYYYPITQMRKPRSRKVNWLAQGHPTTKWLSGICAQVCLSPQWGPWASGTPKRSRAAH